MNFFKKKKPLPDVAGIAPEAGEASASEAVENPTPSSDPNPAPAYSAETMLGGLGWYRTQYQRAMKLALVLVLALCVSAAVNVLLIVKQPTPRYFAATPDLRLAPLVPLDKPLLTQQGLLNWVTETICMIQEKRLSVSAVVTRAPVISASGLVGGKATWKVEFPLVISYESSQGVESTQRLMATVLVCRASTAITPRGVVIQQVVLKRGE